MAERLRVAIVTPEVSPFAKAGRLGDFAAGLARRLAVLGADVSLVVPKYRTPEGQLLSSDPVPPPLGVPMDGGLVKASLFAAEDAGVRIYLIDHPKYFLRDKIYGPAGANYLDNDERFIFFSRAAAELLLTFDPPVDIVHCQDWPTALLPVFLKTHYRETSALGRAATILTIHSPADQGEFPPESLAWTGLNWDFFNRGRLDLDGKFNFLKAGIAYSDLVSVAAPADEGALLSETDGGGLGRILRSLGPALVSAPGCGGDGSWDEAARGYIELYAKALESRRGGEHGRERYERQ